MSTNNDISKTISVLRFPLIVGIVFIHYNIAQGIVVQGVEYGSDAPLWLKWIVNLCSDVLPRIGVPMFFFISGYLFFKGGEWSRAIYLQKLRKRFHGLLIPYLLWGAIAVGYFALKLSPMLVTFFPNELHFEWNFHNIFWLFWNKALAFNPLATDAHTYPLNVPLWYVRELMLAVIFSPFIYWIISRWKGYVVWLLGLIWFLSVNFSNKFFCFGIPLEQIATCLFFFTWGGVNGWHQIDFIALFRRFKVAPYLYAVIAMIDAVSKDCPWNHYLHTVGIIVGIIAAFSVASKVVKIKNCNLWLSMGRYGFFIFAMHYIVIQDVGKVLIKCFWIDSPIYLLSVYIIVPILTIIICIIAQKVLYFLSPRICSMLSGNR